MKKLSVLFALLAVAMFAKGQTAEQKTDISLSVADVTVEKGATAATMTVKYEGPIETYVGFGLDVVFPEGISCPQNKFTAAQVKVRTKYFDADGESSYAETVGKSNPAENTLRILVYNPGNAYPVYTEDGEEVGADKDGVQVTLSASSGQILFTLPLTLDANLEAGEYEIQFKDIVISGDDGHAFECKPTLAPAKLIVAGATQTDIVYKTNGTYGTLILPFDAELPANYKAYTVSEIDGKDLVLVEASSIVAFTPYVMEGDDSEVTFTGTPGTADKDLTFGLLTGVVAEGGLTGFNGVAGYDVYICQKQGKEVSSFYKINPEKGYTIPQYRCYLTAPKSGANMYRIGGTTGIDEVTVEEAGDVYDMLGRKVIGPLEKGVYIKNNRKIFVK